MGGRYGREEIDRVVPPAPSTIDLHTHTRRSDGVLEPADLVRAAAAAGVTLLAITDHDTLAGVREVGALQDPPSIEILPGVEINAVIGEREDLWEAELHILGLGVDPTDEAFEAALDRQRSGRRRRFERMIDRLRELGVPVDAQVGGLESDDDDALGRPTVARALVDAGYATSVEDAFRRLLGRGMPAYVAREGMGPVEAIRAIRAAGGLAVLAHFREAPAQVPLIRELMGIGLGGLEVYYRTFEASIVAALADLAGDLALVPTGGSDYHGDLGPYAESHAGLWVPPEVGEGLRRALAASSL